MAAFNDRALLRTKDATGNGDGGAAVKPTNSLGSPNRRRLWGSKASVGLWPGTDVRPSHPSVRFTRIGYVRSVA